MRRKCFFRLAKHLVSAWACPSDGARSGPCSLSTNLCKAIWELNRSELLVCAGQILMAFDLHALTRENGNALPVTMDSNAPVITLLSYSHARKRVIGLLAKHILLRLSTCNHVPHLIRTRRAFNSTASHGRERSQYLLLSTTDTYWHCCSLSTSQQPDTRVLSSYVRLLLSWCDLPIAKVSDMNG